MTFFVDIHNQTDDTKIGEGPILSVTRYQQKKTLSKSGTWGADLTATEKRINHTAVIAANRIIDTKRVVRCHGVRGDATVEIGAGVIDTLGIVAAEYGMDIGGNDLLIRLGNPSVHGLIVGTPDIPLTTKAAIELIFTRASGLGFTLDTTTYLSTGDVTSGNDVILNVTNITNYTEGDPIFGLGIPDGTFINGVTANSVGITNPATATNAATPLYTNQVAKTFSGESVLAAVIWLAEQADESFYLDGTEIVWRYRTRESCGLIAVDDADPVAVLGNDDVVVITALSYQRDSSSVFNRIYPFSAGSGNARRTIDGTTYPLPDGFTYDDLAVSGTNYYYIQHDDSVSADGVIERQVNFANVPFDAGSNVLAAAGLRDLQRNLWPLDTYRVTIEKVSKPIFPGQTIYVDVHRAIDGYRPLDIQGDLLILEVTEERSVDGSAAVGLLLSNQRRWPVDRTTSERQLVKQVQALSAYGQPVAEATHAATADAVISGPALLARSVTSAAANNTTETTLFTTSIPGDTLSTNNKLRLHMVAALLNNSGVSYAPRIRIYYGATTIYDDTPTALASIAAARPFQITCDLAGAGATNAQVASSTTFVGGQNGLAGVTVANSALRHGLHIAVAEDSTAAKNLVVTVTLPATHASLTFTAYATFVELLRA